MIRTFVCPNADCSLSEEDHGYCAANNITDCWGDLQHQHWPKRSQGGKTIVSLLCAGHHDCIDNGTQYEGARLANDVRDGVYHIYDRDTEEVLYQRGLGGVEELAQGTPPLEPFDVWEQQGATLRENRERNPFLEGDWLIIGEDEFGEGSTQGWDQLRLSHQQISQRINTARTFPPSLREPNLSWAVHRRLRKLMEENPEEGRYWLRKAAESSLSESQLVAGMREQGVLPPKAPPVRRYSVAELRTEYRSLLVQRGIESMEETLHAFQLIDWLQERESE